MFRVRVFKEWTLVHSIENVPGDVSALSGLSEFFTAYIIYGYLEQEKNEKTFLLESFLGRESSFILLIRMLFNIVLIW